LFISAGFLFLSLAYTFPESIKCTKVVDGTTIILNNGEPVRLVGVNIPETRNNNKRVERYRNEAFVFTKKMVEGKEVRLEYNQQQRDKQGRLLAYVYLTDGTFLNAEIIKQGYGYADTNFPFKHMEEFGKYEKEAREAKRGLWADRPSKKKPKHIREFYLGANDSTIYHVPTCALIRKVDPQDRKLFNSVKKAVDAGYVPCKICKPPYYK
jgi:micrococcal nuclease